MCLREHECPLLALSGHQSCRYACLPLGAKQKRSAQGRLQQAKELLSCDPRGCPAARYPVCERHHANTRCAY